MKLLNKVMLGMILSLTASAASAQTDPKAEFDGYPGTVAVDPTIFTTATEYPEGSEVTIPIAVNFPVTGTVICNQKRFGGIQTVIIQTKDNTLLQITITTNSDKTINYGGRIMNPSASEGYQLKNNNGSYSFEKYETAKVFQPCAYK
jgi:hypothetical protein